MMAGTIRLFEKNVFGNLLEVPPEEADARRAGRSVSRVHLAIDVLWTAEEEAARQAAEEAYKAAELAHQAERQAIAERKAAERSSAIDKLAQLGLTADEIEALRA